MPHIIINFSKLLDKKLDMQKIMKICFDAAGNSQLLNMKTVEVRACEQPYSLGHDGETSFMHIKITLFPGRDEAKLAAMSKAMYEKVAAYIKETQHPVTNISTQVSEIDPKFCFHN